MYVGGYVKLSQDKGNIKNEMKAILSHLTNITSYPLNEMIHVKALYTTINPYRKETIPVLYKVLRTLPLDNQDFHFNIKSCYIFFVTTINRVA